MKRAIGRGLVAHEGRERAQIRKHRAAVEERRLRPPRAPLPPGRMHDPLGEALLAGVARRQGGAQLRPEPLEIPGLLAAHHGGPRPQPMPQSIPARCRLARGRPGPCASQGIAAVGGDLGGGGHGSRSDPEGGGRAGGQPAIPHEPHTPEEFRRPELSTATGASRGGMDSVRPSTRRYAPAQDRLGASRRLR